MKTPPGGGIPVTVLAASNGEGGAGTQANKELPEVSDSKITITESGTYTLNDDVSNPIVVNSGIEVTLNLNGHNITVTGDHAITNNGMLTITGSGTVDAQTHAKGALYNNGTVIINGGTFTRSKEAGSGPYNSGGNSWYYIYNAKNASMTLNSCSVPGTSSFSSTICNLGNMKIVDGTYQGGINVVKNDDYGTLEITGGTFSNSDGAAIMNWNYATISGGTFSVSDTSTTIISNGCTTNDFNAGVLTITGGTFVSTTAAQNVFGTGYGSSKGGSVTIQGGSFSGGLQAPANSFDVFISGGTFTDNPAAYDYLTDEVEAVVSNSGQTRFGVYRNLQDAVDDANASDTVTVYQSGLTAVVDENSGIRFETAEGVTKPTLVPPASEPEEEPEEEETYIPSTPISDGWHHYSSGSMYYQDGKRTRGWADIDGARYYFDEKGFMAAGWTELEDGWYYFAEDGKMATGWLQLGNTWYYLDPATGRMYDNGLATIGKYTYYFYDWGGMANSWWYEDGEGGWYFFGGDGAMKAAQWLEWKGEWYYLTETGKMAVSTDIGGYTVNAGGVWVG